MQYFNSVYFISCPGTAKMQAVVSWYYIPFVLHGFRKMPSHEHIIFFLGKFD
jgi:hypothetical protein